MTPCNSKGVARRESGRLVSCFQIELSAVNKLRVYVALPEVDVKAAQNGARATMTLDEFPGQTYNGVIVRNSDSINLASRTLNVEVDVNNLGDRIKTGAYTFVHLKLPDNKSRTATSLDIPANTLLFRSEGLRVGSYSTTRLN
jgi:multidrug efflux pump subunit AcrA (membrane-fusion protein)